MADSSVSNFAPEFQPLIAPLVGGALEAYNRPVTQAVPGLTPQQQGALNWTNTLTTRPIDTTPMRNLVAQGTRPTMQIDPNQYRQGLGVATGAFNTQAGLQAANPYDEMVRQRAMTDFDEQASQASARRAAQQIGTRGLGTKTSLGNAQFSRDMERQRGDLNSQLLQRGFETGRQQFNTDQQRALQAAMANQQDNRSGRALGLQAQMANQQTQGRDRALSLQGANQLQGLENFERQAMAQNAGALQNTGSMVAGQQQALYDYPWQQVNRLRSVLSNTGQQQSQGSAPWWQTAASLAGTANTVYNSGILQNLLGSGAGSTAASAAPSILDGIASGAGFARGGAVDDEDEPRGAFDFAYDDDEEDEPVAEQPDAVDADYWEVSAPDGGGEDEFAQAEEGGGGETPEEGAVVTPGFSMNAGQIPEGMTAGALPPLAEAAPAQGALAPPGGGGLASKIPTSGYTNEQLQAALARTNPQAIGNRTSAGADALSALLLGIGAAPTRDFGRALAAGGQNMTAALAARKREDQLAEQARQKAAALEAKTISDQMGKDRDIQGKATIAEAGNTAAMDREIRRLEAMDKRGELDRTGRMELGRLQTAARLQAANIGAGATMDAARLRAQSAALAAVPEVARLQSMRDALPEGSPQRAELDAIIRNKGSAGQPDVVRMQQVRDSLPEGSPQRAELDAAIKARTASGTPEVTRLMEMRDSLPEGDPRRAEYDGIIQNRAGNAATTLQRDLLTAGLKPGTPEWNQAIMNAHAPNGFVFESDGKGNVKMVQGKGVGGGNALGNKAQGEVEGDLLDATRDLMALSSIRGKFDPKFMEIPEQAFMEAANLGDKFGMNLSRKTANDLDRYYSFRADVGERMSTIRNKLFGAALTATEQKSAEEFLLSNKDGPKQFESKLKRTEDMATKAVARLNYIRTKGLSMEKVGLDEMPDIIRTRGKAIEAELKGGGMNETQARGEAKRRVAREFGLVE